MLATQWRAVCPSPCRGWHRHEARAPEGSLETFEALRRPHYAERNTHGQYLEPGSLVAETPSLDELMRAGLAKRKWRSQAPPRPRPQLEETPTQNGRSQRPFLCLRTQASTPRRFSLCETRQE